MAPFVEDDPTAIPVPPTRPSTPTLEHHRLDRIAEAPSRAEPALPYVETSSPIQAPPAPMTFATNGNSTTNGHEHGAAEENEQNGSQETTSSQASNPALPITNGRLTEPTGDLNLSSCTPRSYIPTPYNSPVRQNPRLAARQAESDGKPSTRLRGGGPTKRTAGSPNVAPIKKPKIILNHRPSKKERMLDDPEAVLADGNSLLYSDVDIAAILQHPTAVKLLAGTAVGDELNDLPEDTVRRAIAEFVDNGRRGYNDPIFLGQCLEARERRATGEFDEHLDRAFRETWLDEEDQDEVDELA